MTPRIWPQSILDRACPELVEAARFECQRRADSYPAAVAAGRIGRDEAEADYQAWQGIVEWLETGRFLGFYAEETDTDTWIDFAALEAAAAKALAKIEAKLAKQPAHPEPVEGPAEAMRTRRDQLFCIHRAVDRQKHWLDETNRQLQERARQDRAAKEPAAAT